jgi:4-phytase/acid phosphatase
MRLFPRLLPLLAIVAAVGFVHAATAAAEDDSELKCVVILTRHGVRAPLDSQMNFGRYAAEPWPEWEVPAGHLTPHGHQHMALMGEYYRQLLTQQGLLSGDAKTDAPRIYLRADNDERTIATARELGTSLVPGRTLPVVAHPEAKTDPLFRPMKIPLGHPDRVLGAADVLGRIGGNPAILEQANQAAFTTLEHVLLGESDKVPPGKSTVFDRPASVTAGNSDHTVNFQGPLQLAESMVDVFMLEYADGMPMDKVGWGRLTPARLTELIQLHSLFFELAQGSFYPSQAQGSNLVSHILATLGQAASGQPNPQAFGTPSQKVVVIVGHDTNLINVGSLLGASWWLPGTHRNPVLPGGALVFELRERRRDHQKIVCTYYVSQTLEQMRNLTPLSLEHPPAIAPIFLSGCSEADARFSAPFPKFSALLSRAIDPQFVVSNPN